MQNATSRGDNRRPGFRALAAGVASAAIAVLVTSVTGAGAATITQPAQRPIVVALDAKGFPKALTVVTGGFAPRTPVFVEQCDGTPPTTPNWSPTDHCDLGTSPAPANADANGVATFDASDLAHAFYPFSGESPQSIFNCVASKTHAPANGLPTFTNCSIRVSTNNGTATADQVFAPLAIPTAASIAIPPKHPRPKAAVTTTTTVPAPKAKKNGAHTTTTTAPENGKSTRAKRGAASTTTTTPARTGGALGAPPHSGSSGSGVLGLSDPGVAIGWLLLLAGVGAAVASIVIRRRRRARIGRAMPS
jgi:hypothetical protein